MELSIVIPTFNEAENLKILFPRLQAVLDRLGVEYEIIIADAGSKDNIFEIVRQYGASIFVQEKKGFGLALREAFKRCRGDYIITLDADFSHEPFVIKQLYQFRHTAEIIIASRYIRGGFANAPFLRNFLSHILNLVFCFILDLPLKDISSGFRLYHRKIFEDLNLESVSFEIQQEIVVKAYSLGYFINEIPFHYLPRISGHSHLKPLKCALRYAICLLKMYKIRKSILSADYDERAFYSYIPLQRYWQRKRYRIVLDFSQRSERILDIGCGSNKILEAFPQAVGADIAFHKLRYRRHLINPLVNADIFNLPFKDHVFDEIFCQEVIEHIEKKDNVFKELNRVLKKDGLLILGTPDYDKLLWRIIEFFYKRIIPAGYADEHISHYTFKSIKEKLQKYGFVLLDYRYVLGADLIVKAQKKQDL